MKTLAIIPARGGSKRIPKKNIKDFMGKPMIAYAIKAAKSSNIFDEIMVSTDSQEVAEIAKKYGASVPFMRSKKNADDFATTFDVINEVVNEYKKLGKTYETLCCIYPCVPFLKAETLIFAHDKFKNSACSALLPVVKYSYPIQRAFFVNENGHLEYREPENRIARTQDLKETYHDVGMFYFLKIENIIEDRKLLGEKINYIVLNEEEAQDIDTFEDWKIAEKKIKVKIQNRC